MSERSEHVAGLANQSASYLDWRTPEKVLACVRRAFGGTIALDPANNVDNSTRASVSLTEDGLSRDWSEPGADGTFVNPPYGKGLRGWVEKIGDEARKNTPIIALLPSNRFETGYLQTSLFCTYLSAMVFVKKRLAFKDADGKPAASNTWGSVLWCFNMTARQVAELAPLGKVVLTKIQGPVLEMPELGAF